MMHCYPTARDMLSAPHWELASLRPASSARLGEMHAHPDNVSSRVVTEVPPCKPVLVLICFGIPLDDSDESPDITELHNISRVVQFKVAALQQLEEARPAQEAGAGIVIHSISAVQSLARGQDLLLLQGLVVDLSRCHGPWPNDLQDIDYARAVILVELDEEIPGISTKLARTFNNE